VSAEWCGFTNHPWGRGLINYAPEERERAMEDYATWVRLFELLPYYSWIVDRFHLSTQAEQARLHGDGPDFGWLERLLLPLGFRVVLCVRRPDTFAAGIAPAPPRARRVRRRRAVSRRAADRLAGGDRRADAPRRPLRRRANGPASLRG
jgi:hypothetical protein